MLKPLFARVLIEREQFQHKSLFIPQDAARRNAPCIGKVIAKGPTADAGIETGKTYLFGQHAGTWVNEKGTPAVANGETAYFVCKDEDLIAEVANG